MVVMMKKWLAVLLSLCMAIGLLPVSALAAGEEEVYQVGDGIYETLEDAIDALSEDGQTITLLQDATLDRVPYDLPYSFTLTAANQSTLRLNTRWYMSADDPVSITLENINIVMQENRNLAGTSKYCNFNVQENVTLILNSGATLVPEVSGAYISASDNGVVVMNEGSSLTSLGVGISLNGDSVLQMNGGSIEAERCAVNVPSGSAQISGGNITVGDDAVGVRVDDGANAEISGGTITVGENSVGAEIYGGNGVLKLSGAVSLSVYLAEEAKIDLTEIGEDAKVEIMLDESMLPAGGSSVVIANITGETVPAGISLSGDTTYVLEAGKKLDKGLLFIKDTSVPGVALRGNGTEDDPFRVKSYDELAAAVSKINTRDFMNYVMVDGPFTAPESSREIISLRRKMTLYSNNPAENAIYCPLKLFFISGSSVELVLEDIVVRSDPDGFYTNLISVSAAEKVGGLVTVNDGVVFEDFTGTVLSCSNCNVVINGGTFRNNAGAVSVEEGSIAINGGSFINNRNAVSSSRTSVKITLKGDYVFSGNDNDFSISDTYEPIYLDGKPTSPIKINVTFNRKKPVVVASAASYLEDWEENIFAVSGDNEVELKLSDDGLSLLVSGTDRQSVSFSRTWNSSTLGTLPGGQYQNASSAGKQQVRVGSFYTNGITQIAYNGYDVKAVFNKVLMQGPDGPMANFQDSAGNTITDENGYIIKWDSPDLEYYTSWSNGIDGASGTVYGENGVIDNIPGDAGVSGMTSIRYKGSDRYLPCWTYDQFSIYGYEMITSDTLYTQNPELVDTAKLEVIKKDIAYTGEEVAPEIKITVTDSKLFGGQPVELVEGQDYFLGVNEEDWQVGENRTAWLYFMGSYYPGLGGFRGYAIPFNVTKGMLDVTPYNLVVAQDSVQQSFDLSKLTVAPAQEAYTYTLGTVPENSVLENVTLSDGKLLFTAVGTGEVTIPVTVDSANASGEAQIKITVADQTSGPVVLTQNGKTFYFITLQEAMNYAQDGDTISLAQVMDEEVMIDKAVTIDGGKTGGLSGAVTIAANVKIQECDLKDAEISVTTGGESSVFTHNYWNSLPPEIANIERNQVYPFYSDAEMAVLVDDPAIAVDAAISEADKLIFDQSENLISLRDIRNKMEEKEVQDFLRSHKADFEEILDKLNNTVDEDVLNEYLESNPEAKELLELLKLAYDVSCMVVPVQSIPSVEEVVSNAQTQAGETLVENVKQAIIENVAVSSFIPVFGGSVDVATLDGVTDATKAVYLKVDVATTALQIEESEGEASVQTIVFEVTPKYAVNSSDAEYQILTNDKIKGNVTFRLPIPESVTQTYAKITHSGDSDRYLTIQTQDGCKYIELSASNFSPYTVSFTNSKPSSGGGGGGGVTSCTVTFDTQGGSMIDSVRVNRNTTVEEPKEPTREGYTFEGWYTDKECTEEYDFSTKVTKSITLYAKWAPAKDEPTEWENPFTDVNTDDWYYEDVKYAEENGLFSGMSATTFEPDTAITRGMIVTVLWRAENEPVVNYLMTFVDVDQTAYYAEAVRWAASNNIVEGYDAATFAPNTPITREQIAAILERYADYKGMATEETDDLARFTDTAQVSGWALGNVQWAVGAGLIAGRDNGSLDPQGSATRAEVAAILHRFLEK